MVVKFIRQFIIKDTLIFFLISLSVITSVLVLNFSYGLYQNFHVLKSEELSETYEITLSLRDENIKKKEVENYILNIDQEINDSILGWVIYLEKENIQYTCCVTVRNGIISISDAYSNNLISYGFITKGNYFNKSQEENGDMVAIAYDEVYSDSENHIEQFKVENGYVNVMDKKYRVIGYQNRTLSPMVPFLTIDDDIKVTGVIVNFENILTRSQYDYLKMETERYWGDRVRFPNLNIPDNNKLYMYNTVMFIALVISAISAMNFLVLYRYILLKRKKCIAVFRICGCRKRRIIYTYILECASIIIPFYIVSTIAYNSWILPLFKNVYIYMEASYSLWVYFVIFAIYFIVSLIFLLIMILNEININPVNAVKGET